MKKTAGMVIRLSHAQFERAARHAKVVNDKSIADGRTHRANMERQFSDDEILQKRIMGTAAEVAAAMFLEVPWEEKIDVFTAEPDVPGWDVRSASTPNAGLIFRPSDKRDRNWILLYQKSPREFVVQGWIYGEDAEKVGRMTDFGNKSRPAVLVVDLKYLNKTFPEE